MSILILKFNDDNDTFEYCPDKLSLDEADYDYFNSNSYLEPIHAVQHIFVAEKYRGYPMIPGPLLLAPGVTGVDEKSEQYGYVQRLHVQVAVNSGFPRSLLYSELNKYVIHHKDHNKLNASRSNLMAVPMWLNSMMQSTNKEIIGVSPTKSGTFSMRCVVGEFGTITHTYGSVEKAAIAWLQTKRDYLKLKNCEEVKVFDCNDSKWKEIDALKFAYIQDSKEIFKEKRSEIYNIFKNPNCEVFAKIVKYPNGDIVARFPLGRRVLNPKKYKIDIGI